MEHLVAIWNNEDGFGLLESLLCIVIAIIVATGGASMIGRYRKEARAKGIYSDKTILESKEQAHLFTVGEYAVLSGSITDIEGDTRVSDLIYKINNILGIGEFDFSRLKEVDILTLKRTNYISDLAVPDERYFLDVKTGRVISSCDDEDSISTVLSSNKTLTPVFSGKVTDEFGNTLQLIHDRYVSPSMIVYVGKPSATHSMRVCSVKFDSLGMKVENMDYKLGYDIKDSGGNTKISKAEDEARAVFVDTGEKVDGNIQEVYKIRVESNYLCLEVRTSTNDYRVIKFKR